MALTTESYRLVEAYYRGELSDEEAARLRARLRDDTSFAADVREWEAVFQAMQPTPEELTERESVRARYRDRRDVPTVAEARTRVLAPWWGIAAAVLLVAAVAVWLLGKPTVAPADAPVASTIPFLGREGARLSPEDDDRSAIERAYLAYDTANYAVAAPVLLSGAGVAADSLNLLYGGVARLNLGEAQAAIAAIEPLLRSGYYEDYLPEINYYLGLAYRAADREAAARERLAQAAAEPGPYGSAAREALGEER